MDSEVFEALPYLLDFHLLVRVESPLWEPLRHPPAGDQQNFLFSGLSRTRFLLCS